MSIGQDFTGVVDTIYESALDPEQWPSLLEALAGLVGGESGGLHVIAGPDSHAAYNYNRSPEFLAAFNGRFRDSDLWVAPAIRRPVGTAMIGSELLPASQFMHTEYYQECLKLGDIHDTVCMFMHRNAAAAIAVTINRPDRVDVFGESERRALQAVAPHLLRLAKIHVKFGVSSVVAQLQERALDRLKFGVVLLSRDFGVVFANKAAHATVRSADGLGLSARRLTSTDTSADTRLAAAQARALAPRARGGVIAVERGRGGRPYVVQIMPLGSASSTAMIGAFAGGPSALVVITDPDKGVAARGDLLAALYGLTPAETRVCLALASGHDVAEIAVRSTVTEDTARWHIRNIFAKMGVRRQTSLVRLVDATLAPITDNQNQD